MNFVRPLKFFSTVTLIFIILYIHFDVITCNEGSSKRFIKRKGTVKTYKNEFGDIFDCVNLYQQPAFDHPLLINHTIQEVSHEWLSKNTKCPPKIERNFNQRCPKGTIPIKRSYKHENQFEVQTILDNPKFPEYAVVKTRGRDNKLFGVAAHIKISNPGVYYFDEYSLASISLNSGHGTSYYTSIEAGWITVQGATMTCFDLNCAGFFQTNSDVEIGGALEVGKFMSIGIYQDTHTQDWWLIKDCEVIGYWSSHIVPALLHGAEEAVFGGEVENKLKEFDRHSKTQMGNGRLGTEGEGQAAEIKLLQTLKQKVGLFDAIDNFEIDMNEPNYYNAMVSEFDPITGGVTLYYGGPRKKYKIIGLL